MEPSLGLWPEAKLDGSMQMPGLLQPLLSGTGQRQVSAIQGFGLEPVHERLPRVFTAQGDQPFLGAMLSCSSLPPRALWFLSHWTLRLSKV